MSRDSLPQPAILHFADAPSLVQRLATDVAGGLAQALAARGEARLVVSGGKSPIPFFHALRQMDLAWARVRITLADERWVTPDHADSNERLVREHLLQDRAAAATFIGLKQPAPSAAAGCEAAWRAVRDTALAADELILGMGEDGHTASLFPGMPGIAEAMDLQQDCRLVAAEAPAGSGVPAARISLNLSALLSARTIRLQISGPAKRQLLEEILAAPDPLRWPVSAVLDQGRAPVTVYTAD